MRLELKPSTWHIPIFSDLDGSEKHSFLYRTLDEKSRIKTLVKVMKAMDALKMSQYSKQN